MKTLLTNLKKRHDITASKLQRNNELFVTVPNNQAVSLVTYLRDHEGFSHLVILSAVDWLEEEVFQLTYLLNNPELKQDIGVRTLVDRNEPVMESIHHLWEHSATYQRELFEMFGISFPTSPRMEEPFILEGWDGPPPYRRDFDTLKYAEETYFPRPGRTTNDVAAYMKEKLYPEDDND
ncbi:MAG: NADH-quinone oxidoreductase subunit C [Deltaproteobacteria bacterium]|nr:NADH-quinone oxidoreductase subunit C [Deltaproteobacteria bacterium]